MNERVAPLFADRFPDQSFRCMRNAVETKRCQMLKVQ